MRKNKFVFFFFLIMTVLMLCLILFFKVGTKDHSYKKIENLKALAEQGDKNAQTDLGFAYGHGVNIDKNYKKAFFWYKKAAMQGSVPAQYNVGLFYEKGWGVTKNLELAREFYTKAADQGSSDAQVNLGVLYIKGLGGNVDYIKARELFLAAAEKKQVLGMYNLGYLYNYGLGVYRNETQAAEWYTKAAKLGSMSAKNSLALFYANGYGSLPIDRKIALRLLESSACQGYAIAQNNLGVLYSSDSDELKKDLQQAYAWFSVAYYNGAHNAIVEMKGLEAKLNSQEITDAKLLSAEYITKYSAPENGLDTNKSDTQCRWP